MFSPLPNASKAVSQILRVDEAPERNDLARALLRKPPGMLSHSPYSITPPGAGPQARRITVADHVNIPVVVSQAIDKAEVDVQMGLFEPIHRAWFAVDNTLMLWNYYSDEVVTFSQLDQLIVSVGLGYGGTAAQHRIIISTLVEVLVLDVNLNGTNDTLTLVESGIRAVTDGVAMRAICGVMDGRIFLAGHDGTLYELAYKRRQDILTALGVKRQCTIVDRSHGTVKQTVGWVVPTFVKSLVSSVPGLNFTSDPLISIQADSQKQLLYTMSKAGVIALYNIVDPNKVHFVAAITNLFSEAKRFITKNAKSVLGVQMPDLENIQISSMDVVENSPFAHLVLVTSRGVRLYLTTCESVSPAVLESLKTSSGRVLQIFAIRGPPARDRLNEARADFALRPTSRDAVNITAGPMTAHPVACSTVCQGDVVFLAFAPSSPTTATTSDPRPLRDFIMALTCDWSFPIMPSSSSPSSSSSTSSSSTAMAHVFDPAEGSSQLGSWNWRVNEVYREHVDADVLSDHVDVVAARVWAFKEEKMDTFVSSDVQNLYACFTKPATAASSKLSEMASQHAPLPRRRFLMLTSTSLWILVLDRPINEFHNLFEIQNEYAIKQLTHRYGLDEACSMALAVGSESMPAATPTSTEALAALRATKFLQHDGYPYLIVSSTTGISMSTTPSGGGNSSGSTASITSPKLIQGTGQWSAAPPTTSKGVLGPMSASSSTSSSAPPVLRPLQLPVYISQVRDAIQLVTGNTSIHIAPHDTTTRSSLAEQTLVTVTGGNGDAAAFRGFNLGQSHQASSSGGGDELIFSGAYSGLLLRLARLLRPLWEARIVGAKSPLRLQWNAEQLDVACTPISILKTYMENEQPYRDSIGAYLATVRVELAQQHGKMLTGPGKASTKPARVAETERIVDLYKLIAQTEQALHFFILIQRAPGFVRVESCMRPEDLTSFADTTFSDFIATSQGPKMAITLVKALLKANNNDVQAMSGPQPWNAPPGGGLISDLQKSAPCFFSAADEVYVRSKDEFEKSVAANETMGFERALQHAKRAMQYVRSSLDETFQAAAKNGSGLPPMHECDAMLMKLEEAAMSAAALDVIPDGLVLCLTLAERFAQAAAAMGLGPRIDQLPPIESWKNTPQFRWREQCYNLALNLLEASLNGGNGEIGHVFESCWSEAISSKDKLWHFHLYRYAYKTDFLRGRLIHVNSPHVEEFLKDPGSSSTSTIAGAEDKHINAHLDLYASWLLHQKRVAEASRTWRSLALLVGDDNTPLERLPHIQDRVTYLAQALEAAWVPNAVNSVTLTDSKAIQEELDIATMQLGLAKGMRRVSDANLAGDVLRVERERVFDPSKLYNDFAAKYGLWEECIEIMRICRYREPEQLQELYDAVIGGMNDDVLETEVARLAARFYVDSPAQDFAFPIEFLIKRLVLERGVLSFPTMRAALKVGGVSYWRMFLALRWAFRTAMETHRWRVADAGRELADLVQEVLLKAKTEQDLVQFEARIDDVVPGFVEMGGVARILGDECVVALRRSGGGGHQNEADAIAMLTRVEKDWTRAKQRSMQMIPATTSRAVSLTSMGSMY